MTTPTPPAPYTLVSHAPGTSGRFVAAVSSTRRVTVTVLLECSDALDASDGIAATTTTVTVQPGHVTSVVRRPPFTFRGSICTARLISAAGRFRAIFGWYR